MGVFEYKDPDALLSIMHYVDSGAIADAMRKFAEMQDEPTCHFECGGECRCGYMCGEDDDCFACGERDNLYELRWTAPHILIGEQIVRCADCRFYDNSTGACQLLSCFPHLVDAGGYCAWGERRSE